MGKEHIKKRIEMEQFSRFRKIFPVPDGKIIHDDKPDFTISSGGKKLGIEVTSFHIDEGSNVDSEQKQKPRREEALKEAQDIYEKKMGRGVEFSFSFDKSNPIEDSQTKKLGKKIAEFMMGTDITKKGEVSKCRYKHIPELNFVWINLEKYSDPQWRIFQTHLQTHLSTSIFIERLKKIVEEKEKQAGNYRPCDEYWLLISMDFMNPAQDQELCDDLRLGSEKFSKILLYKTCFERVLVLKG